MKLRDDILGGVVGLAIGFIAGSYAGNYSGNKPQIDYKPVPVETTIPAPKPKVLEGIVKEKRFKQGFMSQSIYFSVLANDGIYKFTTNLSAMPGDLNLMIDEGDSIKINMAGVRYSNLNKEYLIGLENIVNVDSTNVHGLQHPQ